MYEIGNNLSITNCAINELEIINGAQDKIERILIAQPNWNIQIGFRVKVENGKHKF